MTRSSKLETPKFLLSDDGPSWMNPQKRQETTVDIFHPEEVMDKYKLGKAVTVRRKQLEERCASHDIPLFEMRQKIKTKGWLHQPKGMLQIVWERGFIDPSLITFNLWRKYPEGGKKDNFGQTIEGTPLKDMMASLPDFVHEKKLLQLHAEDRSTTDCQIIMIRSPKCHPEIAGEGIEYDWAGAISSYRRSKLSVKKGAANFRNSVRQSLESVKFKQRISFSGLAREYMLAYDVLALWEGLPKEIKGEEPLPETSAQLLDLIVNERKKSPRGVGKDWKLVKKIMFAMKEREVIVIE